MKEKKKFKHKKRIKYKNLTKEETDKRKRDERKTE